MGFFSRFEGRIEDSFDNAADKMFKSPISPVLIAKKAEKEMRRERMVGAGKMHAPTLYTVLVNPEDDARLFGYYPTLAGETETYIAAKADEEGYVMDGAPLVRFVVDDALRRGKFDIIAELVSKPIVGHLRAEEMRRYGLGDAAAPGMDGFGMDPAGMSDVAVGGYGQPASTYGQQAHAQPYGQPAPAPAPVPGEAMPGFIPADDCYGGQSWDGPIHSAPVPGSLEESAVDEVMATSVDPADRDSFAPAERHKQNVPLPYVPEDQIDRSIDYGQYTFDSQDFVGDAPKPAELAEAQIDPLPKREGGSRPGSAAHAAAAAAAGAGAAGAAGVASAAAAHAAAAPAPDATALMNVPGADAAAPQPQAQAQPQAALVDLAAQKRYLLGEGRITIGRDPGCTIVVNDLNASRRHAELCPDGSGRWIISDLGSTNGTKVNGVRVNGRILENGDRVTIGVTNFSFRRA